MTGPLDELFDAEREKARRATAGPQVIDTGIVTSTSPLLVNCSGLNESTTKATGLSLAVGDAVLIARSRGVAYAVCKVGTGTPPDAPVPDAVSGSDLFAAQYTWSWRDGRTFEFQPDVRQGAQDGSGQWTGAWFYQGGPSASLAGVTVTSCSVRVKRASGGVAGAQAAHLRLASTGIWPTTDLLPPVPSGVATDVVLLPGEAKWSPIPASWGQAMVDTDAGLMVYGASPQVFLAGRESDPESGLLRIDWERA